jgi:hypothetical protein
LASVKKEDKLKPLTDKILDRIDSGRLRGVYAFVAAIQENVFWLYNRELLSELVTKLFRWIKGFIARRYGTVSWDM